MKFFEQLGERIQRSWKDRACDYAEFPAIATDGLRKQLGSTAPPAFADIVEWAATTNALPPQQDIEAQFGQPPLTMFSGGGFHIELLFWATGIPNIHQHAFSGVFYVLQGSSLHTTWQFESEERISHRLLFGRLTLAGTELLTRGNLRTIYAGNALIHSTFHLDAPTITLVVRTTSEKDKMPQYSYYPPCVAFDPDSSAPEVRRRNQILRLLAGLGGDEELLRYTRLLLENADPCSAFEHMVEAYLLCQGDATRSMLLGIAAERQPRIAPRLGPVLQQVHWREQFRRIRRRATTAEQKLFLAALLNVPDKNHLFPLLAKLYGGSEDEVIDRIARYAGELGAGAEGEPNPARELMLRCLLRSYSPEATVEAFAEQFGAAEADHNVASLVLLRESMKSSILLAPLLSSGSPLTYEPREVAAGCHP